MKKLTLILLLLTQIGFSQTNIVKETIDKIDFNEDTIKSVFDWIADNIRYDVSKYNEIENRTKNKNNSGFKTKEEYNEHLLMKVIKNKKGVCEDYSLLFDAIVRELGYESIIIEGYSKDDKGKINRSVGHAWNAVKVNNKWKLYDPTWGAGYVKTNTKFIKKYFIEWYDVEPDEMIKRHMPFDPIWQLSENPISYDNFDRNTQNKSSEEKYNFDQLIQEHLEKEKKEQMQDQVNRSKELGMGNRLVTNWRSRLTKSIDLYGITSQLDLLDEANEKYNKAVELYNNYIAYKNKQFQGKKGTIENAQSTLEEAKELTQSALTVYQSIKVDDNEATSRLIKSISSSEKLLNAINREQIFLEKIKLKKRSNK